MLSKPFTLQTTQRALNAIYGTLPTNLGRQEIKLLKVADWRLELSAFTFDTKFMRTSEDALATVLTKLSRYLALHRPSSRSWLKATHPLELIYGNSYILTVVDISSCLPWTYGADIKSTKFVMECLRGLVTVGSAQLIYSDQGAAILSQEIKDFLEPYGVYVVNLTLRANGRYGGLSETIWTSVQIRLADLDLTPSMWSLILPDVLSKIGALAGTAIRETPYHQLLEFNQNNVHILLPNLPGSMPETGPSPFKTLTTSLATQLQISDFNQELDVGDSVNKMGDNHLQIPTQIKDNSKDQWVD